MHDNFVLEGPTRGFSILGGNFYFLYHNWQAGSKRKRECDPDDISRGAARAHQFLKEFSELPLEKMDRKQIMEKISMLNDDMQKDAVNSQWLQQFIWF